MNKYEVMFIVKPAEEEATNAVIEKVEALIARVGGTVEKVDRWGKRRLAYAMLRKLGDGSFNQFLPGLQSFGFGSFCHD